MTLARRIDGWSARTRSAAAHRHVLAIHDASGLTVRTTPARPGCHRLGRADHDRAAAAGGGLVATAAARPVAGAATIVVPERFGRPARRARRRWRRGPVTPRRRKHPRERDLPASVTPHPIAVVETAPPAGAEPVHGRPSTTRAGATAAAAWRVVGWAKRRRGIEQLARLLKRQGLRVAASRVASAPRLLKLAALATRAAAVTRGLTRARAGQGSEPAAVAFGADAVATPAALNPALEGQTALQRNPQARDSLAWAAWIIARPGGRTGEPAGRPSGPIPFRHGLERLALRHTGRELSDGCMP